MNKSTLGLNRLSRLMLAITLGLGLVINLSGCAALFLGGAVGGAMSVSDRRTFGAQTEDASIELKAANRISNTFGDEVHVNVNSYNRKVLLTGEVKDDATKVKVENEVKTVQNIASIVNEIKVSLFLSSFNSRSSDSLITAKAKANLVSTADIYSSSFKIVTEAGVVYLMGRVSQREGNTAAEAVRGISGVSRVVKVFEYIDENDVKNYVTNTDQPKDSPDTVAPASH